jgi:hypothetical protein
VFVRIIAIPFSDSQSNFLESLSIIYSFVEWKHRKFTFFSVENSTVDATASISDEMVLPFAVKFKAPVLSIRTKRSKPNVK